jgi:hypothetical protein
LFQFALTFGSGGYAEIPTRERSAGVEPLGFALDADGLWCGTQPDRETRHVRSLVEGWLRQVPALVPFRDQLLALLTRACVAGVEADATAVCLLAVPQDSMLFTGVLCVVLRPSDTTDPDRIAAAFRAEVGNLDVDGLCEVGVVALNDGSPAARVRVLDEVSDARGEPVTVDSLRYYVPHPAVPVVAALEFATEHLEAGDPLIARADRVARSFQWVKD